MKKEDFGFKNLFVWQKAIDFADNVIDLTENMNTKGKHYRLIEQIEASSSSIAQNIAEGKGRHFPKEFIQYLYVARGSLYETVTLLNLFFKRKWIDDALLNKLEAEAFEIVSMLKGLINSIDNKTKE